MATNAFHIVTNWHVTAPVDLVAAILTDAPSLPRWWPDVYRAATITAAGDARNIGRKVAFVAKGKLPYHINWTAELLSADLPHRWEIAASGDLTGRGILTLQQDGPVTVARYDWQVHADRPLFAWNHRWAMARGEAGLAREVMRRRAG